MGDDSQGTEERIEVLRIESPWLGKMLGSHMKKWERCTAPLLPHSVYRATYELEIDWEGASVSLFPRNIPHPLCQEDIANGGRELTRWVVKLCREKSKKLAHEADYLDALSAQVSLSIENALPLAEIIQKELERLFQNYPDQPSKWKYPPSMPDSPARCI